MELKGKRFRYTGVNFVSKIFDFMFILKSAKFIVTNKDHRSGYRLIREMLLRYQFLQCEFI